MGELTLRALNLLLVLAGCIVLNPPNILVDPAVPAGTLFLLISAQALLAYAGLPRTPAAQAPLRRLFLCADLLFICWTLNWLGCLDSDLFCALLLPCLMLGLSDGAGAAAGGGLLAAAVLAAYLRGGSGFAASGMALRAALLVLVPAAACFSAQSLRREDASRARRAATSLRAVQLAEFLSWVLYQLREYLISISSVAGTLSLVAAKEQPDLLEKTQRLQRLICELNEKTGRLLGDKSALTTDVGAKVQAPFDLRSIVEETVELARLAFAQTPVAVTVLSDAELPPVSSDRRSFQICLLAVLQNSLEACGAKGTGAVTVLLRRAGGHAQVEVTDDGGGMQADERVFEPLFNARAGTGGMGFGLPMSRRILQRLGGDLRLKSKDGYTAALLSVPLAVDLPHVRNEDSSWAGRRRNV